MSFPKEPFALILLPLAILQVLTVVRATPVSADRTLPLPPPRPSFAAPPPRFDAPLPVPRPSELGGGSPQPQSPAAPLPGASAPPVQAPYEPPPAPVPGAAPLPTPRPANLEARPPDHPPSVLPVPSANLPPPAGGNQVRPLEPAPEEAAACEALLASGKIVGRQTPPVVGAGGCGIAHPLVLSGVIVAGGRLVPLAPAALMRCDLAGAVADWIRDDVVPAAPADDAVLAVADGAAYDCRARNHVFGAQLSEHGKGNAIDIVAFKLKSRAVSIAQSDADPFWSKVKATACARFATILGPGSDSYHRDHLHLDLEPRRNGVHMCQWDQPPPDPASAPLIR